MYGTRSGEFLSRSWEQKDLHDRAVAKQSNAVIININPLHPNISGQILHTVLYTFPKVLTRRICLTIKASQVGDHFLYSHGLNVCFRGDSDRRK